MYCAVFVVYASANQILQLFKFFENIYIYRMRVFYVYYIYVIYNIVHSINSTRFSLSTQLFSLFFFLWLLLKIRCSECILLFLGIKDKRNENTLYRIICFYAHVYDMPVVFFSLESHFRCASFVGNNKMILLDIFCAKNL